MVLACFRTRPGKSRRPAILVTIKELPRHACPAAQKSLRGLRKLAGVAGR